MTPIRAKVKRGRLELDVPPDWPDGAEVDIQPSENQQLVQASDNRRRHAAESIKGLYEPGGALTEWTVLDREEFDDEPDGR
jgi:hypothetical protein